MLADEIKGVIGRKKKFLLLRISDLDATVARKICGVSKGTYTSWLRDEGYHGLYDRINEFSINYKQEAVRILRKDNQLAAVLLEEKIINKLTEEVNSGEYQLIKTHLAREVYTKLMGDLDAPAPTTVLTWEQRIQNLSLQNQPPPVQIEGGEVIEGQLSTNRSEKAEHSQGNVLTPNQQILSQIDAEIAGT